MKYNPPINAERIRPYYSNTLTNVEVLLTGHSHRAWPDLVEQAQLRPVKLAQIQLDHKWEAIFGEIIPKFQKLVAKRIGTDKPDHIANGENTHELVTRVLSCFPWDSRTRFVTTDSEFHSMRRQLNRLEEEGVNVAYVPTQDKSSLTERLVKAITPGTNVVLASTVFFNEGYVLQEVPRIIARAREVGAVVVLDAYHHFNARRLEADKLGRDVFIAGGGYKYASGGEGAAWLKVPENCTLRPAITGWFADFKALEAEEYPKPVQYGEAAQRFLGATRDISGICRQIAVLEWMNKMRMTVDLLERNHNHQTKYIIRLFDDSGLSDLGASLLSSRKDSERGPFVAIDLGSSTRAHNTYQRLLNDYSVLTDTRGSILRLGPAPYTTKDELDRGMESLKYVLRANQ